MASNVCDDFGWTLHRQNAEGELAHAALVWKLCSAVCRCAAPTQLPRSGSRSRRLSLAHW